MQSTVAISRSWACWAVVWMHTGTTLFLLASKVSARQSWNGGIIHLPPMLRNYRKIAQDTAERIRRTRLLTNQSRNEQQKAILLTEVASLRCTEASDLLLRQSNDLQRRSSKACERSKLLLKDSRKLK